MDSESSVDTWHLHLFGRSVATSRGPGLARNLARNLAWDLALFLILTLGPWACGGGSGGSGQPGPAPTARVSPAQATVKVDSQMQFSATDEQGRPLEVTYRVVESSGGSIAASGRYQAPLQPGTYHVQVQSTDRTRTGEALVQVEPYLGNLPRVADTQFTRIDHSASLLEDGSVLVVGGTQTSQAERFLPGSKTFVGAGDTGTLRWAHTTDSLPGGSLLFTGGLGLGGALASSTLYQNGAFTTLAAAMATPRHSHRSARLSDGRLLLTGGLPMAGSDVTALAACELFDPARGRFAATAAMSVPRANHTATTLADGRVLVIGGRDSTCVFNCSLAVWRSAEIYDPAAGTFTAVGSMAQRRFNHTATLLPDGRVLVAGGTTPDLPATDVSSLVEVFDPATNQFQVLGNLLRPRSQHTATLLGDGTVLLAGGATFGEGTLASATVEAFRPATGLSRLTLSDITTRYRHAAVRLQGGHVLLVGGSEGGAPIERVELYD